MSFKKLLFFVLVTMMWLVTNSHSLENKIILKIEKDIITTVDIKNEAKYLSALNPKIIELDSTKIFEISKNSLVREKIKKIELLKNSKKVELNNDFLEKIIQTRYNSLGLKTKDEFIKYLKNFDVEINTVVKKIEIEALWNQLIFFKFSKNIKIDKEKLLKNIQVNNNLIEKKELLLKEILFNVDEASNFDEKYNEIKKSITDTGFENTASLYSISDSSKTGGDLGWISENSLNPKIKKALLGLNLKEYSSPINLSGGFLILQISDIKIIKEEIDTEKELKKAINVETNRQLNQFSNVYFNKAKKEISIHET